MKTPKLALLILCTLCALCALARGQSAAPPPDTILKQLKTELKPEADRITELSPNSEILSKSPGRVDEEDPGPWDAGQWTISPFGSYRAHEIGKFNGRFGAGLAVSYAPVDNIAVELETLGETWRTDPWIDTLEEAGVNFKGYLPFGSSGLAGYGFIGYTRNLQEDQNRMNAGAGLEVRAKRVYAFGDGRWTHDFVDYGHALFRLGVGLHF